jgi:uncharacterized protein YbjT (DUF2867 family)
VSAEDVSQVAATLLANPSMPSQRAYALISETLTVSEIVETISRVVGRPIRYIAITDEQWADTAQERINPHALDHLSHLWQYFRKSEDGFHITDAIRSVTGRKPQTLEAFFRAKADVIGRGPDLGRSSV